MNRSHSSGCSLVGCTNTSFFQPFPQSSTLSRESYLLIPGPAHWLPAGDSLERKSCQEFLSPKTFFSVQFLNYLNGKLRLCFCIQTFSLCAAGGGEGRGGGRGGGGGGGGRGCFAMCYFLSAMPQAEYLHPELSIKIKVADIKMINNASQSQAPI